MNAPTKAWAARFLLTSAVALLAAGCVQRNVESISSEEAATMPAPPPPQPPSQQSTGVPTSTRIAGTIELDPGISVDVPATATLYLIVRVAGRETGAPLAVQQILAPSFPFSFEITERDAMIEGTPLIGEMSVTARVDQDGDAFTSTAGDMSGRVEPVVAGDVEVVLLIDTVVEGERKP
jgi:hypothetical protein